MAVTWWMPSSFMRPPEVGYALRRALHGQDASGPRTPGPKGPPRRPRAAGVGAGAGDFRAGRRYQMRPLLAPGSTMASPSLQPHASRNSLRFDIGPFTRQCAGAL